MKLGGLAARPSPDSSPARVSRRPSRPVAASPASGRAEESRGVRNQSITDFFKPIPKQDRFVLHSPQKINHQYGRDIVLNTGVGQFGRKRSTTKSMCREMPISPPKKSPIKEALMRGFKEKKGERDVPERNHSPVIQHTQSLVVGKSLISTSHHCLSRNEMKDPRKQDRSPIKMLLHNRGDDREKKKYTDPKKTITDAGNLVSSPKPEILRSSSSKFDRRNDISRCLRSQCSVKMQQEPIMSRFQLSLKSFCRERELKKQRQKLANNVITPEKTLSGESSISLELYNRETKFKPGQEQTIQNIPEKSRLLKQENGCFSRKRLHFDSLEAASDAESSGMSDIKTCIISSSEKERVTLSTASIGYSSVSPSIKKQRQKNYKDITNTDSMKTSSKSLPFQNNSITKCSPAILEDVVLCSPSISRPHNNLEKSSSPSGSPRKKLKVYFDSDEENFDCNLESDGEDVVLKPLQQIMSLDSSQSSTPEKSFVLTEKPRELSSDNSVSVRYQCFENSLERLAKENENPPRSDEWEKELKEDLVKGQGIRFLSEAEETENPDDTGELQEEHKEFLRKFFIALDTIPDCHPGEEIFHCFDYGKIFNQHTLDLRDCNFVPKNAIEDLILKSGKTQQIFLSTQGYLSIAYHCIQCPIPVLKWLFQMMSVHTDYVVSIQLLNTLIDITIRNDAASGSSVWPWIPSLFDIATVFVNMGVSFKCLFPVQNLQPVFNEDIFNFEVQSISEERKNEDSIEDAVVSCLPETNILNVVKFIGFCTAVYPEGYTDQEIILLLLMFLKMSLEKDLKQIALVDFQSLLINLLKNIRDWDTKIPELCVAISELSTHHHNLLWLVQFVPNWTARGRQVRQHLSLVIISKFLDKKPEDIPSASDLQMSLLCQYLIQMKPSDLLRKMIAKKTGEQQGNLTKDCLGLDLEQQVYYLTYVLLHLVSEVSSYSFPFQRRKYLLQLCGSLEKHIKCCIREDARFFHRTKVIDLVAIIHGKWQDMIQNSQPIQGKLHDFWVPDS
ncbi:SMC5-SMC6 complex localization factor protein 2 isoform X2 [Macrotis lagotis]|uniref:SMC5-SMC6 complex localization factor protein 2 isoform X2 n=1 Tax=Macrotis lagotis TaxID=92651 RepID=UPI003D693361